MRIDVFFNSVTYTDTFTLNANTVQQCSGNCYSFGRGVNLVMQNSVMLRDLSARLFLYGTTDVIVGGLEGFNAVLDNDFNARGEYQGGPDGCAFDFETSAEGFVVSGNTFYRSYGAGVMIFGHETTSHNISIVSNTFAYAGCIQNRGDRGGIAVMCPNNQKPSGNVSANSFITCPGVPAISQRVDGCDSDLLMEGNIINPPSGIVEMPQISFNPPSPQSTATYGTLGVIAVTETANATIRYTMDGSRPTETSPIFPAAMNLKWPGPAVVINARAFHDGMLPSVTNGAVIELNYGFGRLAPAGTKGPSETVVGSLQGNIDTAEGSPMRVTGWAVDSLLPHGGYRAVVVVVFVDNIAVATSIAQSPRPDLVPKEAPNSEHGFSILLSKDDTASLLGSGKHLLSVKAVGCPSCEGPTDLPQVGSIMYCDGKQC